VTVAGGALGRLARAIWGAPGPAAALARGALLPPAALYRAAVLARNAAYDAGWLASRRLPVPSVGVGNLAVGGVGKTPVARYLAGGLARRGCRVGILLRGYGDDEVREYGAALPDAVVVANPDRHQGAFEAVWRGADVLVLDDCLQRRDVAPDLMLALVAAESWGGTRWPLPAGPWREGLAGLRRADALVVTCKSASVDRGAELAASLAPLTKRGKGLVAGLSPAHLLPLGGGERRAAREVVAGRKVVALCGIGAPDAFAAQLRALGAAQVDLLAFGDHHAFTPRDVSAARGRAGADGLVVTTEKDAVKLRGLWPPGVPDCRVAVLDVSIRRGDDTLARFLDEIAGARRTPDVPEGRQ
jgi:tetraacyldisaccharide 4'-kinase